MQHHSCVLFNTSLSDHITVMSFKFQTYALLIQLSGARQNDSEQLPLCPRCHCNASSLQGVFDLMLIWKEYLIDQNSGSHVSTLLGCLSQGKRTNQIKGYCPCPNLILAPFMPLLVGNQGVLALHIHSWLSGKIWRNGQLYAFFKRLQSNKFGAFSSY